MGRTSITTLTRTEIADTIADRFGITRRMARDAMYQAVREIAAHLMTPGNRVEIRGLGTITTTVCPSRRVQNPQRPGVWFMSKPRLRLKYVQSHTFTNTMPCPSGVGDKPGQ